MNLKSVLTVSVLLSILIAIILAPKNSYFFSNFAYYWVPQAIVLILLFVFKVRIPVMVGASLAMTVVLISYFLWISSLTDRSSGMAWIGYFMAIPGAFVGTLFYHFFTKSKQENTYMKTIISSMLSALLIMGMIQIILCSTVFHCG